eukprot:SM000204S05847  [mRNA]  locus=s204:1582:4504:- [translate_table: standard]
MQAHDNGRAEAALRGRSLAGGADLQLVGNLSPTVAGLYYTSIQLGASKETFNVQIDTGSDLLWVNCAPCKSCPSSSTLVSLATPYDPAKSSSASAVDCSSTTCSNFQETGSTLDVGCVTGSGTADNFCYYQLQYGDGSQSLGYLVDDVMTYNNLNGSATSASVLFGCAFNQSGNLVSEKSVVDGLMGLGVNTISITSQLVAQRSRLMGRSYTWSSWRRSALAQKKAPNTFAHCLGGEADGGGILVLGNVSAPGASFTPLLQSRSRCVAGCACAASLAICARGAGSPLAFGKAGTGLQLTPCARPHYYAGLNDITVGTNSLGLDSSSFGYGTIFDSGTTLASIPSDVYNQLAQELTNQVSLQQLDPRNTGGLLCWDYTGMDESELATLFPVLTLNFDGADMPLSGTSYILLATFGGSGGNVEAACLGLLAASDPTSSTSMTILGDIVLQDQLVIYDVAGGQLGWLPTDCKKRTRPSARSSQPIKANDGDSTSSSTVARSPPGSSPPPGVKGIPPANAPPGSSASGGAASLLAGSYALAVITAAALPLL